MNKSLPIILVSIVCFIAGTWAIVDLYKSQKAKNETKQLDLSKVDFSKAEINIEGRDLTQPFTQTISTPRPEELNIQYLRNGEYDKLNSLNTPFMSIDSMFKEVGAPTRYKSIMKSSTSYVFDDLGFYVKSNEEKHINLVSIYFQKGKLDIAPKSNFEGSLTIDALKINSMTTSDELMHHFSAEQYLSSDNYYFEKEDKRFVFSFDKSTNTLINVLIEKR